MSPAVTLVATHSSHIIAIGIRIPVGLLPLARIISSVGVGLVQLLKDLVGRGQVLGVVIVMLVVRVVVGMVVVVVKEEVWGSVGVLGRRQLVGIRVARVPVLG